MNERKELGPKAPCPCNSGKKYKNCCRTRGLRFVVDLLTGDISQEIPMTEDLHDMLAAKKEAFIRDNKRMPRANEPIFGDIDPEEFHEKTVAMMEEAGIDPAMIYAFKKTGRIVTEENMKFLSEKDLEEWQAAIDEFEEKFRD